MNRTPSQFWLWACVFIVVGCATAAQPAPFATITPNPNTIPASKLTPTPTSAFEPIIYTETIRIEQHQVNVSWYDGVGPPCAPRHVASIFVQFLDAFNQGDQAALSKLILASEIPGITPDKWFSFNERSGKFFRSYDIKFLLPYFAERHQQHETMTLQSLTIDRGWYPAHMVGVIPKITRRADDREDQDSNVIGKGVLDCQKQSLVILSLAVN